MTSKLYYIGLQGVSGSDKVTRAIALASKKVGGAVLEKRKENGLK